MPARSAESPVGGARGPGVPARRVPVPWPLGVSGQGQGRVDMAIMVPDSCPSSATAGEKRVFGLLRDALPGHFFAWSEPVVVGRFPDFSLLAHDFGLLMLEVKGWYAGQVERADDHSVDLRRTEGGVARVERHKHPARQAREYLFALTDELARP